MTIYTLYIKSGISNITPETLNTFLRLLGYDAICFENTGLILNEKSEYNRIIFHDLKTSQKAEVELRKMFYCYIVVEENEFDKTGITKTRIVNITSFKESGRYYDNFNIRIPEDTKEFNLIEEILKTHEKLPEYFMYHGYDAYNVPFIIPAHRKASDMKQYVKIGETS